MKEIGFELEGLPKTPNALLRKHWAIVSKEHKRWHSYVWAATLDSKPDTPFKRVDLTFVRMSSSRPDYDGLVGSFKPIIDGLVKARVIADDTPEVIGAPKYIWEYAKPRFGKVKIIIKQRRGRHEGQGT